MRFPVHKIHKTEFPCARIPVSSNRVVATREIHCTHGPPRWKTSPSLRERNFRPDKRALKRRMKNKKEEKKKGEGAGFEKLVERDLLIAAFLRSGTITWYLILFKRNRLRRRRSLKKGVLTVCTVTNFARALLLLLLLLSLPSLEQARSSETTLNSPLPPSEYGQFVEGKRAAKLTLSRLIKNLASHLLPSLFFFFLFQFEKRIFSFPSFFISSILLFIRKGKNWIKSHGCT